MGYARVQKDRWQRAKKSKKFKACLFATGRQVKSKAQSKKLVSSFLTRAVGKEK
jgi:hypothetical protein